MPSLKSSIIPSSVNPDLQKERDGASFDVVEFQTWWYGGAEKLKRRREIAKTLFEGDNDLLKLHYLSWEEIYNESVKDVTVASEKLRKLQAKLNPGGHDIFPLELYHDLSHGISPMMSPLSTHLSMFIDVVKGQGTPEQVETFGKDAENCHIIGTYAQTELAHGTNVRGIETRADYDREREEFVLNTPNLQAYKWWPGGLGHTANHAMVVAQLYIGGVHKGIQMFIVPLRDRETHMPLPGIDIGEIGRKVGMAGVNQGFLGLKNVRIPRTNMLMKNAKVLPDGTFQQSPAAKLSYLTMVYTRCLVVIQNATFLAEVATIATRYSAVRRQSPINPNEPEPQIMDHVTQQLKLFPQIAISIAYNLAAKSMWDMYDKTVDEINRGEFGGLQELHALSCVLKALCTADSMTGIECLRLACGGHGYMAASNIDTIYGNAVAACTYEGENTVLLLQVGRFLVKAWHDLINGEKLQPTIEYLREGIAFKEFPPWDDSWLYLVKALQYVAAQKTRKAYESLTKRINEGQTQPEALNNTGIELIQAAELHGHAFVAAVMQKRLTIFPPFDRTIHLNNVLENIMEIYLVYTVMRNMGDILRFIPWSDANLTSLQYRLEAALKKFRPDAVAVCDGFDFYDRMLNSVLGSYDGNIYERIFEAAKKSPLNQRPVQKSFETYLKPFMKANM